MRTTLNLNDELVHKAMKIGGITEKTKLIHAALESYMRDKAYEKLANMRGVWKNLKIKSPRRRRS